LTDPKIIKAAKIWQAFYVYLVGLWMMSVPGIGRGIRIVVQMGLVWHVSRWL